MYASPCVYVGTQYCQQIISMSLEFVGLIILLLYIVVFSFICILFLGTLAQDLIFSLCSFYANIFCGYRTESNLI